MIGILGNLGCLGEHGLTAQGEFEELLMPGVQSMPKVNSVRLYLHFAELTNSRRRKVTYLCPLTAPVSPCLTGVFMGIALDTCAQD